MLAAPQVRVFSNTDHVRALAAGEVDAVVGWSGKLPGTTPWRCCCWGVLPCWRRCAAAHNARRSAFPPPCPAADDILPLVQRTNNLDAAAPLSGTSLFADCWCIPTAAAGG